MKALAVVYPPMRWTTRWSDGANIPFGKHFPPEVAAELGFPDYYERGLWLFSEQGHGHKVPDAGPELAGRSVMSDCGSHALRMLHTGASP